MQRQRSATLAAVADGPIVLVTDNEWYERLSREASGTPPLRLDEACFWHPRKLAPVVSAQPGEVAFFKLKSPLNAIGGYGFFASFFVAPDANWAWRTFGVRAGADSRADLARLLGRTDAEMRKPLGCTLLRGLTFWPDHRWLPWGKDQGFIAQGNVRGGRDKIPANATLLLAAVAADGVERPADLDSAFRLVEADERPRVSREIAAREGQGVFRARLLDAYGGQCAITGEHTELVLDAAHIQPYLGPASNHVQNGLLLTSEFHTLFDNGLVAIEPPTMLHSEHRVRVSKTIRERWNNGHRYNEYDGRTFRAPVDVNARPSRDALEWHLAHRFERVA
jgi:putative restriction endonuclease